MACFFLLLRVLLGFGLLLPVRIRWRRRRIMTILRILPLRDDVGRLRGGTNGATPNLWELLKAPDPRPEPVRLLLEHVTADRTCVDPGFSPSFRATPPVLGIIPRFFTTRSWHKSRSFLFFILLMLLLSLFLLLYP